VGRGDVSARQGVRFGGSRRGEAVRDRGGLDPVAGIQLGQDVGDVDAAVLTLITSCSAIWRLV
jgi:hypothetical protein